MVIVYYDYNGGLIALVPLVGFSGEKEYIWNILWKDRRNLNSKFKNHVEHQVE